MRKRIMYFLLPILFSGGVLVPSLGFSQNCPKIQCDCESLPNENWQKACSIHESNIKKSCVRNGDKPTAFCSLHGPAGKPLPFSMSIPDVEVVPENQVAEINRKVAALFWSIRTDSDLLTGRLKKGHLAQAKQIAKLIETNLENLFRQQMQATHSLIAYEDERGASRLWSNYGEDNEKMARGLRKVGSKMWAKYEKLEDKKTKKTYRIISQRFFRMAGEAFELGGYAYGKANKNRKSAKAWESSSEVAKVLVEQTQSIGGKESHIQYYRYQVAARLHRASYHWVLGDEPEDATQSLNASKEYMEEKKLVDELLQAESGGGSGE